MPDSTVPDTLARRTALLSCLALAALPGAAQAQMGGGMGGGMGGMGGGRGGHPPDGEKPAKQDDKPREAPPPRDLVERFAARLHEDASPLAVTPPQQRAWSDFLDCLTEVGQHNARRLQRILWLSAGNVSASAPVQAFIASELAEGEDRQQALADLKAADDRLQAQLDDRQRATLARMFLETRTALQAAQAR